MLAQLLGLINVGALFACVVVPMFDMDNSRIDECVDRLYERKYEMYNMTSKMELCSRDDTSHSPSVLANISIVYGNESETKRVCEMTSPTAHFPEYFTYSMLLVLISCAVYQMMISALKAVYLIILSSAYLIIVHKSCSNLFDNQDFLLQTHDGYRDSIQLITFSSESLQLRGALVSCIVH